MHVNWQSQESHILINPRMPKLEQNKLNHIIEEHKLKGHIFIATSGSTATESSDIKWVALKKSAFLISANNVNQHLGCTKKDIFLNTLPLFHVGGLALFARAHLCDAQIINCDKWNPQNFLQLIDDNKATISSLVPTQIFDLVQLQLKAPPTLRAVVVGGGFLDHKLFLQASKLNWPLLPSYGMTECCSQIATARPHFAWSLSYPELTILPHINVSFSSEGKIELSGDSLLSGYIMQSKNGKSEFIDPKINGKIVTNDLGAIKNGNLVIYGNKRNLIRRLGKPDELLNGYDFMLEYRNWKPSSNYEYDKISYSVAYIYNNLCDKPIVVLFNNYNGKVFEVLYKEEIKSFEDISVDWRVH